MATNTVHPNSYPANPARPDLHADQAWIRNFREDYDRALHRHDELLARNPEAAHFYWAYAVAMFTLAEKQRDVLVREEEVTTLKEQLEKWRLLDSEVAASQTEASRWQAEASRWKEEAVRWKARADQKQEEVASSKNEQQRHARQGASAQVKYDAVVQRMAATEAERKRLATENEKLRRQLMVVQTGQGAPQPAPQRAPAAAPRAAPAASPAPAYAPAAVPSAPPAPLYAPTSGRADAPSAAPQQRSAAPPPPPAFAPIEPSPPPPSASPPPAPAPPAVPADGSPQGAFVRWCQEGGGLIGRAYRFAQASGLEVEPVFRECNALGVEFSAQPSDPAEYWLVRQGADLLLFPQPLSSNAFRELDERLFEPSGAQPRSLSQIVPCKVQRDGDNLHVVARGKIA